MKLVAPTEKDIILPAIWTSAAVEVQYRKRLQALVDEMCGSTLYWITAAWKKGPPVSTLAEDADPVAVLRATLEQLQEHWSNRIDDVAVGIAEGFAQSSMRYSDTAFHAALKKAGFTVPFTLTEGMEEAFNATVQANVALIRSIPSQYFVEVSGEVWRAVQNGHDLGTLSRQLHERYAVTRKRAAFIARDQASKANAVMKARRYDELGITEAKWRHSGAGKEP